MFDSILVPVDLSESNQTVLDHTKRLGNPEHTSVTLLHVIEMVEDISLEARTGDRSRGARRCHRPRRDALARH